VRIYIIIPVFNRLEETKKIISCLRNQITKNQIEIIIINDGSTDGTKQWINLQNDITVIEGNGRLLWGGALNLAINYLKKIYNEKDWVILLNNDVLISENYVQKMLDIAEKYKPAAVGSVVRNLYIKSSVISTSINIDAWNFKIHDQINCKRNYFYKNILQTDVLSGRGVIYPLRSIIECGGFKPLLMPHYYADYELSLRVKKKGLKLLISEENPVYSKDDFAEITNKRRRENILYKLFSRKSNYYIVAKLAFWIEASNFIEKITLLLRIILFIILPMLRKRKL